MLWFLLVAVGVVVFLLMRSKSRAGALTTSEPVRPRQTAGDGILPSVVPASERQVTPSAPSVAPGVNALQPFSPIPLTIDGASPQAVAKLRNVLADEKTHGRDRRDRILAWLLTTNARVKEVDSFLAEWGPRYAATVTKLCEADPEWASAGELDREDIRDGAAKKAIASFDVRVGELEYEVIAEPPTIGAAADDALLAHYGFETLAFYFRNAGDLNRVSIVPSDDWYRPRFEALVGKGLAKRGADVELKAVLQKLTLKEMEALAEGVEHKRFTRKAPAIEFLSTLPDLRDRLGRQVSLREFFQLMPLPPEFAHIDLAALGHAWAYGAEYAKLLEITYSTAQRAHESVSRAANDEYARGWTVEAGWGDEGCCPSCNKQAGERRGVRRAPQLPHHIGCICHLSQIHEYQ